MIRRFLRNEDGNYAAIFALSALPIFGAVALSVDYSNVSRLKFELKDAADAACVPTAKMYLSGSATDEAVKQFGTDFFKENFDKDYVQNAVFELTLPNAPGNTAKQLKCKGTLTYKTFFGPVLAGLTGTDADKYVVVIQESSMRMKNVAEIALVMDNSGSMSSSTVTGGSRIDLIKTASKKLVHDLIVEGQKISNTTNAVKFSLVPFSASVNIGKQYEGQAWLDPRGISPVHHENFNWGTMGSASSPWKSNGADGAKLDAAGQPLTRFSILKNLKFYVGGTESTAAIASSCKVWKSGTSTSTGASDANCAVKDRTGGTATKVIGGTAADTTTIATSMGVTASSLTTKFGWGGCVEARPYPYNVNDAAPTSGNPATLFVPMFAPDEYNNDRYGVTSNSSTDDGVTANNWWPDTVTASSRTIGNAFVSANPSTASWQTGTGRPRLIDATKYYNETPYLLGSSGTSGSTTSSSYVRKGQWHYFKANAGPNQGCTTDPILPLTGTESTVTTAIDNMEPTGNTNVSEGLAWGWRTISSGEPFTEAVAETNKGTDKVIIVFTDGINTYSAMNNSVDYSASESTYAAYGYTGWNNGTATTVPATQATASNKSRIFQGTTLSATDHTSGNFSSAMIAQMNTLCTNIKATDRILLMTVGLDLNPAANADGPMITALSNCAGYSRTRKDTSGSYKKMFWNACTQPTSTSTCTSLDDTFKQIKDELSNLRFVG